MTTRERARCGHENVSSHEEEEQEVLFERTFESSNKALLGIIECSDMFVEENNRNVMAVSVERSDRREMETDSQSDGKGLHPSVNEGMMNDDEMAYGSGCSQWDNPGVNELVPHPVLACPHNMNGDERQGDEWYGDDGSRRCQSTLQERPSYDGEFMGMPRAIRLNLTMKGDDVKEGGAPPHPVVLMAVSSSSEGNSGVYPLAAGGSADGIEGRSSDLPSVLGASEDLVKGGIGDELDYQIGRVGRDREKRTERSESEVRE